MRKQTWIRYGLASVIMMGGAFAALAVVCGGDDSVNPPADGGHADVTASEGGSNEGGGNEGGLDSGKDADAGPAHAKIVVVHASPNAPDIRFCFGTGVMDNGSDLAVGPLPALPHDDSTLPGPYGQTYPALYAGTGGALPDLTNLETKAVTGFVIPMPQTKIAGDVKSNAQERTCDTLIGANGAGGTGTNTLSPTANPPDYIKLPTIPKGTFKSGNTYLLAITGCLGGDTSGLGDGKAKCGSNYDKNQPLGNLGIKIIQLDRTVADTTKLGLAVVHASSAVDGFLPLANGGYFDQGVKTTFGLTRDDLDGGSPPNAPVAVLKNYGYGFDGGTATPQTYTNNDYAHAVAYAAVTGFHTVPANPDAGTDASVAAVPATTVALPFGVLQKLSYGSFDGGIGVGPTGAPLYVAGQNYTLIFLGDPTAQQLIVQTDAGPQPNPNYKGYGLHMMMFPNDPPLPKL